MLHFVQIKSTASNCSQIPCVIIPCIHTRVLQLELIYLARVVSTNGEQKPFFMKQQQFRAGDFFSKFICEARSLCLKWLISIHERGLKLVRHKRVDREALASCLWFRLCGILQALPNECFLPFNFLKTHESKLLRCFWLIKNIQWLA